MLEQAIEFEQCVAQAFELSGFTPRELHVNDDKGFDFVLTLNNVAQYAVEVKFYRSKHPKSSLIKTSAKRLLSAAKAQRISKAILVISSFGVVEKAMGTVISLADAPAFPETRNFWCVGSGRQSHGRAQRQRKCVRNFRSYRCTNGRR